MVTVRTYGGAPTLKPMVEQIKAQAQRKKIEAVLALAEAVDEGTLRLQDALEEAVTRTGERRVEMGGVSAGRHRSGEMVASISNNTHMPEYDGERTVMALGWFAGQFQSYFLEQDLGLLGIPAANAMAAAKQRTDEVMQSLMEKWKNGALDFDV